MSDQLSMFDPVDEDETGPHVIDLDGGDVTYSPEFFSVVAVALL